MTIDMDVAIVGAGPAGLATAIQLNRFNINCRIVEKNSIGGLLKNANKVENYLGFPEGVSGKALVELFEKQLRRNNIQIIFEEATNIDYRGDKFLIATENHYLKSNIAVIATGTKPKQLKGLNEGKKTKSRIFYEVHQIQDVKSKEIAIIGAGDAAFDYALNLSRNNSVTIFNRTEKDKCLPVLKKLAEKNLNIQYVTNRNLKEIELLNEKLELIFFCSENTETYLFDYLLIAIGREPELSFLGNEIKVKMGLLINDKKLFVVGDVKNHLHRQLSIAAGDGIRAAMEINEALNRTQN